MRTFSFRSAAALGLSALAPASFADFVTPSQWTRGSAYTTYQQWDVFASPTGPNAPNTPPTVPGAPYNPSGAANVVDSSGGSFVTSGGNIYSPTAAVKIDVTVPEYGLGAWYVTTVLLQTRTQGTEATYTGAEGMRLTYADGSGSQTVYPVAAAEQLRQNLGGFGGALVDYAAVFQVPYSPSGLLLEVDASGSSMSFDRAAVDTIVTRASEGWAALAGMNPTVGFVPVAVPEPGLGLVGAGAVAALAAGRRRRRWAR